MKRSVQVVSFDSFYCMSSQLKSICGGLTEIRSTELFYRDRCRLATTNFVCDSEESINDHWQLILKCCFRMHRA